MLLAGPEVRGWLLFPSSRALVSRETQKPRAGSYESHQLEYN
jgi:hypothetical protein